MKLLKIVQLITFFFTLVACSGEDESTKVELGELEASIELQPSSAVELQSIEEFKEQEADIEEQQISSQEVEERHREYVKVLETEIKEVEDVRRKDKEEAIRNGTPLQLVRPSQEARFQEKKKELEELKKKLEE